MQKYSNTNSNTNMRMSCNGCRVLRKGCSENCSIRPCLQWIKNPESQANATVFLAKFYGRAGLMNLINSGPEHHRPAIFRSLLYEACGRIVNPIYGSVGLLWSGSWPKCQAAVEAVLKGEPIVQIEAETAAATPPPPLKAYDIRHVSKDEASPTQELHKVAKATRTRFKRSAPKAKPAAEFEAAEPVEVDFCNSARTVSTGESRENESGVSGETAEVSVVCGGGDMSEVELELTLGFEPAGSHRSNNGGEKKPSDRRSECWDVDTCRVDLALDISV